MSCRLLESSSMIAETPTRSPTTTPNNLIFEATFKACRTGPLPPDTPPVRPIGSGGRGNSPLMRTCSASAEGGRVVEPSRSSTACCGTMADGTNNASAITALIVCAIKNVAPRTKSNMSMRRDVIIVTVCNDHCNVPPLRGAIAATPVTPPDLDQLLTNPERASAWHVRLSGQSFGIDP